MFAAVQIPDSALSKMVPKHLLTLDEVYFSMAGKALVEKLRDIKKLKGKRDGQKLFFCAAHVAEVKARWLNGEYDEELQKLADR